MFHRILIANRGEIALRVIRACRELGVETVAVYSTADRDTLPVQLATRAVCIGPARSAESYLNQAAVLTAAGKAAGLLLSILLCSMLMMTVSSVAIVLLGGGSA